MQKREPDKSKMMFWEYPTNYPVRQYQLDISKKCLFQNTLVVLPTGMGKTLIASVVMHNFYRWFPRGLIVFVAPTRPLVAQQLTACFDIVGLPEADCAHLEGSVPPTKRGDIWRSRRVVYCTPQTMENDLEEGRCDACRIVCLIVDEAHRATRSYAYTGIIKEITRVSKNFRVVGLSATPGRDKRKIEEVVRNLLIAHVEVRCEDDVDVAPYAFNKNVEVVRCPAGINDGTPALFQRLIELMRPLLSSLTQCHIIYCENPNNLNTLLVEEAKEKVARISSQEEQYGISVENARLMLKDLELLLQCRKWFKEEKFASIAEALSKLSHQTANRFTLQGLENQFKKYQVDSQYLERKFPKFKVLKTLLMEHFNSCDSANDTRAIVFTERRCTVQEIITGLVESPACVRAKEFVGQSSASDDKGMTQLEQAQIIRDFHSGAINVLVATCIAEEGLDIGGVDLIIFFDAVSSPIRLVQRMGRTGRKRDGRVVMLVSNDAEQDRVNKSNTSAHAVYKLLQSAKQSLHLHPDSPRMIPEDLPLPSIQLTKFVVPTFRAAIVSGASKPKQTQPRVSFDRNPTRNEKELDQSHDVQAVDEARSAIKNEIPLNRSTVYQPSFHCVGCGRTLADCCCFGDIIEEDWDPTLRKHADQANPPKIEVAESNTVNGSMEVSSLYSKPRKLCNEYLNLVKQLMEIKRMLKFDTSRSLEDLPSNLRVIVPSFPPVGMTCWTIDNSISAMVSKKNSDDNLKYSVVPSSPAEFLYDIEQSSESKTAKLVSSPVLQQSAISNFELPSDLSSQDSEEDNVPASMHDVTSKTNFELEDGFQVKEHEKACVVFPSLDCVETIECERTIPVYSPDPPRKGSQDHGVMSNLADVDICAYCLSNESEADDSIVYCEGGCESCAHQKCFGLRSLPQGCFYCDGCLDFCSANEGTSPECYLCDSLPRPRTATNNSKKKRRLMKKSTCGKLVHPCCVLFANELTVNAAMRPNNLATLSLDRRELRCAVCDRFGGSCVQCAEKLCFHAVHPGCAQLHPKLYCMAVRLIQEKFGEKFLYEIYCPQHLSLKNQDDVVSSNFQADPVGPVSEVEIPDEGLNDSFEECNKAVTRKRLRKVQIGRNSSLNKNCKNSKIKGLRSHGVGELYFENEAALSGSDSGDEIDDDSSSELSGDFINDGEYTQDSSVGAESQLAMYYKLNHEESPEIPTLNFRGSERGLPILERILRKSKNKSKHEKSSLLSPVNVNQPQDSSFESSFVVLDSEEGESDESCDAAHLGSTNEASSDIDVSFNSSSTS